MYGSIAQAFMAIFLSLWLMHVIWSGLVAGWLWANRLPMKDREEWWYRGSFLWLLDDARESDIDELITLSFYGIATPFALIGFALAWPAALAVAAFWVLRLYLDCQKLQAKVGE